MRRDEQIIHARIIIRQKTTVTTSKEPFELAESY